MAKKPQKRPRSPFKNERSADLKLWLRDGCLYGFDARLAADVELSVGRTDSERAMGFHLRGGLNEKELERMCREKVITFVLDRDQVEELAVYLQTSLHGLRKPLGRRTDNFSFAAVNKPKVLLTSKLEDAARKAHPGWRQLTKHDDLENELGAPGDWVLEDGAPEGAKLVKWFKRTHPRKAQRIERDFTRRLWKGQV